MAGEQGNYVAAWHDWSADKIVVLERDGDGALHRLLYNPPYYFYVPDEEGQHETIFGDRVLRAEFATRAEYEAAKRVFPKKFESDFNPRQRVLMDTYYDRPAPPINYAFFDIEVNYSQKIGFAGPTNPYAEINAVTVYQSWTREFLTFVIPPLVPYPGGHGTVRWTELPGNSVSLLESTLAEFRQEGKLRGECTPRLTVCSDELELLHHFLNSVSQADIISGWNSEFFDVPYICERLLLAGGTSLLAKLEWPGARPPRREMVNRYGSEEPIYKFEGRAHLDYMRLFQKFTFEGRVSYALGNILQEEVGMGKLEYDGTLEELYHQDFPTFVAYNIRDVDGLVQLDEKFKFIALANQMAHENTVLFDAVLGTVSYVETGITNHAHYKLNKIVGDKVISEHDKVEGAIVMTPKVGLHEWIGSVDINSLYPNTIRSLNISPEKIVGQFESKEEAWAAIRDRKDARLCLTFEGGHQQVASAREFRELLDANRWAVSAYGTVFDQSGGRGVVADILGFWYSERKRLQAEKKKYAKLFREETNAQKKEEFRRLEEQYDLLQLTKKISMNSLYGALLNPAMRYSDERMGASVTATGRAITTHMIETIGEILTGERLPLIKTSVIDDEGNFINEYTSNSEAILYGDTDSGYFKCLGAENRDMAIEIADLVAEGINDSFPGFMRSVFRCQSGYDEFIKAGREVVAIRGLFQAKKKYMLKVIDKEGVAVNELKSMGSEIKKADTPKIIQTFLKSTVDRILDGQRYEDVATFVNESRRSVLKNSSNVFLLGVAKQVNNLDKFWAEYRNPGTVRNASGGRLTVPGHVRAACNYNTLLAQYDPGSKPIRSGDKVLIYYLKKNSHGYDSIALPAEFTRFPQWFTEHFSVDIKKTEDRMFDSKLAGIFAALGKEVPSPQSVLNSSILGF